MKCRGALCHVYPVDLYFLLEYETNIVYFIVEARSPLTDPTGTSVVPFMVLQAQWILIIFD